MGTNSSPSKRIFTSLAHRLVVLYPDVFYMFSLICDILAHPKMQITSNASFMIISIKRQHAGGNRVTSLELVFYMLIT